MSDFEFLPNFSESECNSLNQRRFNEMPRKDDMRNPAYHDYTRVIHSAAFRRLQNKTQVLGLGDSDFYRTRLTHSIEVAQIGSAIVNFLNNRINTDKIHDELTHNILPDDHQIKAICLAHDIGNPPFGHAAEVVLNKKMYNDGGFEGNGQTLRIISKLAEYQENYGMNSTRRTMLGVLKYPVCFSKIAMCKNNVDMSKSINSYTPPKCYMDDENDVVMWILNDFSYSDRIKFQEINIHNNKTKYKSLDASIMELADDIAYGVHDMEDAVKMGMISFGDFNKYVNMSQYSKNNDLDNTLRYLFNDNISKRYGQKQAVGGLINYFITNTEIYKISEFNHPILNYNIRLKEEASPLLESLKTLVQECVIKSQNVQILQHRGEMMIGQIFDCIANNPKALLSEETKSLIEKDCEHEKRVICDYISGMTDEYADRIYKMLFIPDYGSVFARL